MAEFCLDCFNKINDTNLKKSDVKLSKEKDWCEGCSSYKNVVVKIYRKKMNKK